MPRHLSTPAKLARYEATVAALSTHADPAATQYLSHLEAVIHEARQHDFGTAGVLIDARVPQIRSIC